MAANLPTYSEFLRSGLGIVLRVPEGETCTICSDPPTTAVYPVVCHVSHVACRDCILTWLKQNNICPYCRAQLFEDDSSDGDDDDDDDDDGYVPRQWTGLNTEDSDDDESGPASSSRTGPLDRNLIGGRPVPPTEETDEETDEEAEFHDPPDVLDELFESDDDDDEDYVPDSDSDEDMDDY